MKDFLFLFRGGRHPASPEEGQKRMQRWTTWIDGLAKAGKTKGGFPLEDSGKYVSGANKLVTDGPFPESKEIVGGYLIVTADDLAGAVEISKGCPIFGEGGGVEVRPIMPMSM
jgi:hypothetical protein